MQTNPKFNKNGKKLVIYFSRTGTTRRAAHWVARLAGADLLEIKTSHYPKGFLGYLRAGMDATLGRAVPIEARDVDFSKYGFVIVGTPIWNSAISAPIRTYLTQNARHMPRVAFFITHGGSGAKRAFRQMQEMSHQRPIANLDLRASEINRGLHDPAAEEKIKKFVGAFREPARRKAA